jgi:hypothetical protein
MLRATALASPGVLLAVAGLFHPHHLDYATSQRWWLLHVVGLFVFPLVGVAIIVLVRGRRDPVAWVIVLASYAYAVAYTALDVVNGVAAGYVTYRLGPGVPRPHEVSLLFRVGSPIGVVGSVALMLAALVVVVDGVVRLRLLALPAAVMLPGAYLVHLHHIFAPQGVTGMALIGLATGWLAYVDRTDGAQNSRWLGSSMPRNAS